MAKQARKPLMCRNGCGTAIWFDWERKFDDLGYTQNSDKPNIPLEVDDKTGEHLPKKHQCPNSEYNKKQRGEETSTTTATTARTNTVESAALQSILGNTLDIMGRVEAINEKLDELIPRFNQLVDMYQHSLAPAENPLDDDGDSSRENPEDEP